MVISFLKSEWKKWLRDPLLGFMLFYPILFGLLGRYGLPWIEESSGWNMAHFADYALVILTLLTPQVYGALIGFSILDDRDDHILTSIQVTPLGVHQFLAFRLVNVFVLTMAACAFVMSFSDIVPLTWGQLWGIAFLAALSAPMTGLFINALATNKIEGFAMMKGASIIIILPIIALYFTDYKELFFSFAPGFWPAKAISSIFRGEGVLLLSYTAYYVIGFVYMVLLTIAIYQTFMIRIKR